MVPTKGGEATFKAISDTEVSLIRLLATSRKCFRLNLSTNVTPGPAWALASSSALSPPESPEMKSTDDSWQEGGLICGEGAGHQTHV